MISLAKTHSFQYKGDFKKIFFTYLCLITVQIASNALECTYKTLLAGFMHLGDSHLPVKFEMKYSNKKKIKRITPTLKRSSEAYWAEFEEERWEQNTAIFERGWKNHLDYYHGETFSRLLLTPEQ